MNHYGDVIAGGPSLGAWAATCGIQARPGLVPGNPGPTIDGRERSTGPAVRTVGCSMSDGWILGCRRLGQSAGAEP